MSQGLVCGLLLIEKSVLGAPAGERITDCREELGLENPEDLKAQRDLGGGEGRLLGARRWEKLCFWPAALEIRTVLECEDPGGQLPL